MSTMDAPRGAAPGAAPGATPDAASNGTVGADAAAGADRGPGTDATPDPVALADAVDRARQELAPLDEDIRRRAERLLSTREAFLAAGVREMVRRLKADERSRPVLFELVDDPLVYAVLMELGIVKPDLVTRVARAMERIKPYVKSHGGDLELVRVEGDTAYVRLHGSCSGCNQSAETVRDGVGEAITSIVPEITRVEEVKDGPVAGIVSLTVSAGEGGPAAAYGWHEGPAAEDVREGEPARFLAGDTDVLLLRRDDRLFAYRNACPHQGLPLHEGDVAGETITCPWHGFCFEVDSGECRNVPQVQLEPFPLRVADGVIWVRPDEDPAP